MAIAPPPSFGVVVPAPIVSSSPFQAAIEELNPDFYIPLDDTSGSTAVASSGSNWTYVNNPEQGIAPLAVGDTGTCVGLSGSLALPQLVLSPAGPLSAASFTVALILQADRLSPVKQALMNTSGVTNGFTLELRSGGQLAAYSNDGSSAQFIFGEVGDVAQGTVTIIFYRRQSGVLGNSQDIYKGVGNILSLVQRDTTQRTWGSFPSAAIRAGAWDNGSSYITPFDGLIGHVIGWDRVLTEVEMTSIVTLADSVAWAADVDAGDVERDSVASPVSVLQGEWHGKTPVTVTCGDEGSAKFTTAESGDEITITAADVAAEDDLTAAFDFVDANGNDTAASNGPATLTVNIVEPTETEEVSVAAFGSTRVDLTTLTNWPAGETPDYVLTQGTHVECFIRRSWKPTDNSGDYADFQAGWRKTSTSDAVVVVTTVGTQVSIPVTVTHADPTISGTTYYLDATRPSDGDGLSPSTAFKTIAAAVSALGATDGLKVSAKAGGQMYPVDAQTGGATSTVNGVTIWVDPDDLAAGRRPRIHLQGSTFARYADDLNNGHWEVYSALGGSHGTVYRTTATVGTNKVNVGCSYRTADGRLQRCYTYTNTPGAQSNLALARLTDTTYPRHTKSSFSNWDCYMGPGIYLHSDGKLYIRLTPLSAGIGAQQVNAAAGLGSNPPWDWSQYAPQDTNPNNLELYISSCDQYENEHTYPTTGLNYVLRIDGTTGWTLENLDWVAGGNTIEMNEGGESSGHVLRGCRELGWAPPNMAEPESVVGRPHNVFSMWHTYDVECDRCEFWGGQSPWYGWEENKSQHGAYSIAMKPNMVWAKNDNDDDYSLTLKHCIVYGYPSFTRRNCQTRFLRMYHSTWQFVGMDGALVDAPCPVQDVRFIRSKIIDSSIGGWASSNAVSGALYVGYSVIINVRPYVHDTAYWDNNFNQANQFCCIKPTIGHGDYKELERHFWYQNTAIGSNSHQRASTTKANANMTHDGAGAWIFPYNVNRWFEEWYSRNNILAVFPNGSLGNLDSTRAPSWGDAHIGVVLHTNHVGNAASSGNPTYTSDYNIYHQAPGMPDTGDGLTPSNSFSGPITTVDSGGTERSRTTMAQVQDDTGQEANGRLIDPQFATAFDASSSDMIVHANAHWCLQSTSPAKTGGDTTNRSWPDYDFGTVITYPGHTWLGCMDPDASAVEQQVGPLGPLPSGL